MSWITKIIGVDKVVDNKVNEMLKGVTIPNSVRNPHLLDYRAREYKVWASSNTDNLLTFYKETQEPTTHADRKMFWQWVGGINVPKVHYPAPEIILNFIKGIMFSGDVTIEATKDTNETEISDFNKRIKNMLEDINFDDFVHNGSFFETYSGSLAVKFVIDSEVHNKPILELYPRERFRLKTKYGKVLEYTFLDEYWIKDKVYVLESYYGKGYVKYKLFRDNKEVALDTIEDTKGLEDFIFGGELILATWKKNRTVSNEFSELPYGGSDFEGITDIFHSIDEIFSSLMLYIRRNRPMMGIDSSLLKSNASGSRTLIPKEYEFDMMEFMNNDSNKDKIWRNNPEIRTEAFMSSISDLTLSAYQKIGMSYTTVNDSGIGANASGEAISKREKSTTVMRDSKIKLWIPFLRDVSILYLVLEDFMKDKMDLNLQVEKYNAYKEWDWQIEFPEYNGQSFGEKVKELGEAKASGLMDTKTAVDKLYGRNYTVEEKAQITRNAKIENGITIFEDELIE